MLKNTQTATQGAAVECVSVHINEAHSCFCVLHSLFHGSLFLHRHWIFFPSKYYYSTPMSQDNDSL